MNLLNTVAVASRSFSKNKGLVNALKAKYSKIIFNDIGTTLEGQNLINFLSPADKAIIGTEEISSEILQQLPKHKVIIKYGVGINNLDIDALKYRDDWFYHCCIDSIYKPATNSLKKSLSRLM